MNEQTGNIRGEVLVVDDEPAHAEVVAEGLARQNHNVEIAHSASQAIEKLRQKHYDVIVTDLVMENDEAGLDVLSAAREYSPDTEVILITGHASVPTCRSALQQGACDYIERPLDLDKLRAIVNHAAERVIQKRTIEELRQRLDEHYGFEGIVGNSPAMLQILQTARRIAPSSLPILIQGESGVGKELLAQAIHNNSGRKNAKFVALNCAGLSETLLEDELFGHVKGAYTGATTARPGRFEYANGGTIFLDEVGDMPASMQAKLLRVLENGEVVRVGSNEPIHVDVRVISATNTDLLKRVEERKFREDLYFRLAGAVLKIPPLRERREDIPLLVHYFIQKINDSRKDIPKKITGISPDAMRILCSYDWPGNVRQLRNT
ncbi:sigma-54-dependent Fis family transcriptional regulator, partial [candidate division KSB1 bacterium]